MFIDSDNPIAIQAPSEATCSTMNMLLLRSSQSPYPCAFYKHAAPDGASAINRLKNSIVLEAINIPCLRH